MKNSPKQIEFYKRLGDNIRKKRKALELSQDELARAIGLTRTSLTNIENGRQHPPLHTFCEIVEQLKTDASALLPSRRAPAGMVDVKAIAGKQVRGDSELAFITTGITGITNEDGPHGHTQKKNRRNGSRATDGKRDYGSPRAGRKDRES